MRAFTRVAAHNVPKPLRALTDLSKKFLYIKFRIKRAIVNNIINKTVIIISFERSIMAATTVVVVFSNYVARIKSGPQKKLRDITGACRVDIWKEIVQTK